MSIALQTQVDNLEAKVQQLSKQVYELSEKLARYESYRKPGPKPKEQGHIQPT